MKAKNVIIIMLLLIVGFATTGKSVVIVTHDQDVESAVLKAEIMSDLLLVSDVLVFIDPSGNRASPEFQNQMLIADIEKELSGRTLIYHDPGEYLQLESWPELKGDHYELTSNQSTYYKRQKIRPSNVLTFRRARDGLNCDRTLTV